MQPPSDGPAGLPRGRRPDGRRPTELSALLAVVAVVVVVASVLVANANARPLQDDVTARPPSGDHPSRHHPARQPSDETRELLASMTLEEKVGQVFATYGYGTSATDRSPAAVRGNRQSHGVDTIAELVQRYHLGGVIYFNWAGNLGDPAQIARLSNSIQQAATGTGAGVPAFVAVDQEHGALVRLPAPVTQFPGSMALGATRSEDDAATAASITAREMRALGINLNFAPVADTNVNPANPVIGVRSFSSDPAVVSRLVAAQVRAFAAGDVVSTVKHFPGHGDTDVDSHYGLPRINHTREQLETIDLPPFEAAISAGVDMVMTAHIVVPVLDDSGLPATISRPVLTGLLREQLGFDGVIVTDSLGMQGAQPYGADSPRRVPVEAFKAGADLLLMPPRIGVAYDAMLAAVRSGEITEKRLDASVARILDLKRKRGLLGADTGGLLVDPDAAAGAVGTPEHRAQADQIAERAVTLVSNDGTLPLGGEAAVLVAGASDGAVGALAAGLEDQGVATRSLVTGTEPSEEQIRQAVDESAGADAVVVATSRVDRQPGQQPLVDGLIGSGTPVVVTATHEPYDLGRFPDAAAGVAAYSDRSVSMRAVARVLTGAVNPSGSLPVDVPNAAGTQIVHPIGHGESYGR